MKPRLAGFFAAIFVVYIGTAAAESRQWHCLNRLDGLQLRSIGPFELYSPDSSSHIQLQFAGQLRLEFESRDKGENECRTSDLYLKARRIRPMLSASLLNSRLTFKLHLSTAPGSLELMDFYFNYRFNEQMQFRYGQYKVPFTRYRIQSFQNLTFVDWAIVTKYFGAERQMGLALHNGYEKPPSWGYVVGIFTGVNARASHAVGLPVVYGEEITNPSDLADPGKPPEFHPEIFLHATYKANGIRVQSDSDEEGGPLRYLLGFSAAWDLDPITHQDFSLRLAPELLIKYQGFSISTIGYAGFAEMGRVAHVNLAMLGGLFQAAYRVNRRYEVSNRYAIVDFTESLINDAQAEMVREEEVTAGFNIYLSGHSLKWQHDAGWLRHSGSDERQTDFLLRSQFQVTF
jgi:hypothetical protein